MSVRHDHGSPAADSDAIVAQVTRVARLAYAQRLQTGNGGNLSARLADGERIVIKASGVSFADCEAGGLVTVSLDGRKLAGEGQPSREIDTHLAIYRARPDVGGIFHCHSPWAVAAAVSGGELPLHTFHARSKLGRIPVLSLGSEASAEVATAVEALVREAPEVKAFVQSQHGIFSLAESVPTAFYQAELVEETAKIAWLLSAGGKVPVNG